MAAVLGKRARSFDVIVQSPSRSTRSRRRVSTILEDEEEDIGDTIVVRADTLPPDELQPRTPKRARRTAPPPLPKSSSRVPLSPQKVNTVYKATKATAVSEVTKSPPKTPRHRDAIAKKPTTPRHRVCVVSKPMTPRSKLLATPTHASTPSTVITTAKSLFSRSTQGGRLIGRDTERTKLQSFLQSRLSFRSGGCLYISGPPGCGKSALLTEIMGELAGDEKVCFKKAWINCMSLHTPSAIYTSLLDSFSAVTDRAQFSDLEELFITKATSRLYVLVLDEIDHLLSHDILPTLFELSLRKNSRLVLVGIANALDLADRFLPRLKAKNLEPELLPFLPYTAPQISEVLTTRLKSLLTPTEKEHDPNYLPFVHPAAVQLLSKKVAAASGDLRKAFDILRRALELVEMEALQALRAEQQDGEKPPAPAVIATPRPALGETNLNAATPRQTIKTNWTPSTAPRATLAHVAKASSATLGASISTRIAKLNAHQKAVLCVLAAKSGTTPWSLLKLKDAYSRACKDGLGLMPLVGAEFRGVVDAMEAVGVLDLLPAGGKGKDKEERAVARVGKMELLTAVGAEGVKGREGFMKVLGC